MLTWLTDYFRPLSYANIVMELLTTEKELQPVYSWSNELPQELESIVFQWSLLFCILLKRSLRNSPEHRENIILSLPNIVRLTYFILGSSAKPLGLDRAVKCLTMCLQASVFPDPLSPLVRQKKKIWQCLSDVVIALDIVNLDISFQTKIMNKSCVYLYVWRHQANACAASTIILSRILSQQLLMMPHFPHIERCHHKSSAGDLSLNCCCSIMMTTRSWKRWNTASRWLQKVRRPYRCIVCSVCLAVCFHDSN